MKKLLLCISTAFLVGCGPEIIDFKDGAVKRICLENWDSDKDGELSVTELASVTDLGDVFEATEISTFDEFKYFTGVKTINDSAFSNCESLASITLPDSVTEIGDHAFYDCNSLTSITIGNRVTSIADYAFLNCASLTSVIIPDSVTEIGEAAF